MAYGEMPINATSYKDYWKFNGDSTGVANGTALAATGSISFPAGKFGSGVLKSDTTASYIKSTNNLGIATSSPRTYSFWVKLSALPKSTGNARGFFFVNANNTGLQHDFLYNYNSGNYQLDARYVKAGVTIYEVLYVYTMSLTTWYNLVWTYDGSYLYLYMNGNLVAPKVAASGTGSGDSNQMIIAGDGGVDGLPGQYDEFIIDSAAWTAGKVRRYYNMGLGRMAPTVGV